MSNWRELKTLQEVAAALEAGDEIEVSHKGAGFGPWGGSFWANSSEYRSRPVPKVEAVTLRKALFRLDDEEWVEECNAAYARNSSFVCWLGEPVTYEVKK